jgi:diacylglycerol kinase family enzyme
MTSRQGGLPARLLVISARAGGADDRAVARIVDAFPRVPAMPFDPKVDYAAAVRPGGRLIIAGGDGSIGVVARCLASTDVGMGIISLGTFNNFALALGLPLTLEAAIEAVKRGRPRPITVGYANGLPFLEAAALGLFGEAIQLGEAAKDWMFGELSERLRKLPGIREFEFQIRGDLEGGGKALSLVFANTETTGARLPIAAGKTPHEPYLELSVQVGATRSDLISRLAAASMGRPSGDAGISFRFHRLEVETVPRIPVYADHQEAGRTPAVIEARPGALRVLIPPRARPS